MGLSVFGAIAEPGAPGGRGDRGVNELLVTAGIVALIGAAVGGGLTWMGAKLPLIGSIPRQALLGTLGAGFLALGLLIGGSKDGGPNGPPITSLGGSTSPPVSLEPGACVVTIVNPVVALYEKADRFSQEITGVDPGAYDVQQYVTVTSFLGDDERWLTIEVDGDGGWIPDDTFTIDAKTPGCP